MQRSKVVVPWPNGLHLRVATKLVRVAQRFRSTISLAHGGTIADVGSVLSVIALCATMGTTLDLQAAGDDEQDAVEAIEHVFSQDAGGDPSGSSSGETV